MFRIPALLCVATVVAFSPIAQSHTGHTDNVGKPKTISKEVHPWGQEGDPRKARKTIPVDMADTMRFNPSEIKVRKGETVKFVVRNTGQVLHEMVIGTAAELQKHAELMKKHPGMEHDEPYMAHVEPGKQQEITWTFTNPGIFMYGCLIPGHWESGMKGTIRVE